MILSLYFLLDTHYLILAIFIQFFLYVTYRLLLPFYYVPLLLFIYDLLVLAI